LATPLADFGAAFVARVDQRCDVFSFSKALRHASGMAQSRRQALMDGGRVRSCP
jgi:hypothetical protein